MEKYEVTFSNTGKASFEIIQEGNLYKGIFYTGEILLPNKATSYDSFGLNKYELECLIFRSTDFNTLYKNIETFIEDNKTPSLSFTIHKVK